MWCWGCCANPHIKGFTFISKIKRLMSTITQLKIHHSSSVKKQHKHAVVRGAYRCIRFYSGCRLIRASSSSSVDSAIRLVTILASAHALKTRRKNVRTLLTNQDVSTVRRVRLQCWQMLKLFNTFKSIKTIFFKLCFKLNNEIQRC